MFKNKNVERPKSLTQQIKDAELSAHLDTIQRAAQFAAENEERERDRIRQAESLKDRAERKKIDTAQAREILNKAVPYAPLFLVNLAAITGQIGWAFESLAIGTAGSGLRWIAAILFGITAETIALFLQFYANRALLNRDSAASLYLSAFVVAGLVAAVNFSHWSNPAVGEFFGKPNATAVVFAMCSFVSPWLWRIHNRAEYREALRAAGEIDSRAVKLSMSRKVLYPIRSFQVIRLAAWAGETNPAKAVEMYETRRVARATVRAAEKSQGKTTKAVEAPASAESVKPASVKHSAGNGSVNGSRDWTTHDRWTEAVGIAQSIKDSGAKLTVAAVCDQMQYKNKNLPGAAVRFVNGG